MAPARGSKRKSESPPELGSDVKKYRTRSSVAARKQTNYHEDSSDDEAETQNHKRMESSSSEEDFVIDSHQIDSKEEETTPRSSRKRAGLSKPNVISMQRQLKDESCNAQQVRNPAFKPVAIDSSGVKIELDLSDSDSSSSNDCNNLSDDKRKSKYFLSRTKEISTSIDATAGVADAEQSTDVAPDIWMKNLEALHGQSHVIQEKVPHGENSCTTVNDIKVEAVSSKRKAQHKQQRKESAKSNAKGKQLKSSAAKSKLTSKKSSQAAGVTNQSELNVVKLLKEEEPDQDTSSDDDENWERVVDVPPVSGDSEVPKSVEVILEVDEPWKRKKKGRDLQDLIRLRINRIRKAIQLDMHQISLVSLLAHGFLVNKWLNDPVLLASALSIVPSNGFPSSRTDLGYLEKLLKWIRKRFAVSPAKTSALDNRFPNKDAVLQCISSSKAACPEELVYACVALCRSLGILTRLVMSLQPLPAKVDPNELQGKSNRATSTSTASSSKTKENDGDSKKKVSSKSSHRKPSENCSREDGSENQSNRKVEKHSPVSSRKKAERKLQTSATCTPSSTSDSSKHKSKTCEASPTKPAGLKRSSRKSAEKPINYEESPLETSDDGKKRLRNASSSSSKKLPPRKSPKNSKGRKESSKVLHESEEESDDEYQESSSSEDIGNAKPTGSSMPRAPFGKPVKIISTDSENHEDASTSAKRTAKTDVWLELFMEQEEQWVSVDVVAGKFHCDRQLEKRASEPLLYVVAFNSDLTWKDVTARYASSFLSTTRKQRLHPGWTKLLDIHLERPSPRSKAEDESLEKSLTDRPLPTSISEFKNHPLYALQRHLLKFEAIYPQTSIPIGYVRGEPVYARECVKTLHSRDTWLKQAKVVRIGEKPYKIVKARPKWDRNAQKMITDQPLELFGEWQIEDYIPPPAVNGVVPRNAYGNVELFLPSMLPKGTKHLQIPGLNKVARKLGIDCAPAMTGWDYHGGYSCPSYDGFVVCEEHVDTLLDAWQADNEEREARELAKKEKRVYGNWRRLIRGLLIRERIQTKYFSNLAEHDAPDEVLEEKPKAVQDPPAKPTTSKKRKSK